MWLVPSTWNQLHWSSIARAKFERCILNPWSQMDYTGACFSLDGISLAGGLNSTWFTPRMASVDGTTTLICDQKLDRLLLISAAQATHLTQARSAQESTQQELLKLVEKVDKLAEQLEAVRAGKTAPNTGKIPRAVCVSNIIAMHGWISDVSHSVHVLYIFFYFCISSLCGLSYGVNL